MAGAIAQRFPLGSQWPTVDPFLFVAHHRDNYPAGGPDLGPSESLSGRKIGQDFDDIDGWNMYHGSRVPGFPQHPHRGFETITYVRSGYCDHSDSIGATSRFGLGDTQWMTAGRGVVHCEMFPLLDADNRNPLELFQIWLNLPAADKMVDPYFTMLWSKETPTIQSEDGGVDITVIAGSINSVDAPAPPPDSWASRADADVAVWHLQFKPGARWHMPSAHQAESKRLLYAFEGSWLTIDGERLDSGSGALLESDRPLELIAGDDGVECMVLQGRPIGEPVAKYGPFVMNSDEEIQQAFTDYRQTEFGGWPWATPDPDHGPTRGRFARHADGRVETIDSGTTQSDSTS